MPDKRTQIRFVVAMATRKPFCVEVVDVIRNVGTNGIAMKKALALPAIISGFAPEHVGIVRTDSTSHIREDLDRFCMRVGVTDKVEKSQFIYDYAGSLIEMLTRVQTSELEEAGLMPRLSQSRWGKSTSSKQ